MGSADVTVVIPTYNAGGPRISALLQAIFSQDFGGTMEVIAVDSGSTDETLRTIRKFPAAIYTIPHVQFNHGRTRNYGISKGSGKIIVLLVQDAIPVGNQWLNQMIHTLDHDVTLGAITCRQIPRPDTNPLARAWVNAYNAKLTSLGTRNIRLIDYDHLPTKEKIWYCRVDNVCSAIPRHVWERFPFKPLIFGEDLEWGKRVFEAGYSLLHTNACAVIHSHDRSAFHDLKRTYLETRFFWEVWGMSPEEKFLRALASNYFSALEIIEHESRGILMNLPYRVEPSAARHERLTRMMNEHLGRMISLDPGLKIFLRILFRTLGTELARISCADIGCGRT
jgi:rhamnosyltransferase